MPTALHTSGGTGAAWSWVSSASASNLLSLIATLREEGRLPIRSVQWYLDTVHQLRLSVGAIVSAIHRTAQRAQPAVAAILDRIRGQPGGPRRRNRLARGRRQWLRVDFQHPSTEIATSPRADGAAHLRRNWAAWSWVSSASGQGSGGGRSAGRVVLRSIGQRFLRRLPPL